MHAATSEKLGAVNSETSAAIPIESSKAEPAMPATMPKTA